MSLKNGCRNMCHTLIFNLNKKKYFLPFFTFFSMSWPWILGYEHAFQPYTYSLRPFSRGGMPNAPPQAIHSFKPPSLFRVNIADYFAPPPQDKGCLQSLGLSLSYILFVPCWVSRKYKNRFYSETKNTCKTWKKLL